MARKPTRDELEQRAKRPEKESLWTARTRRQANQQSGLLDLVLESFPDPLYVLSASDYRIIFANTAANLGPLSEDSACYALLYGKDRPCGPGEHACPVDEVVKTKRSVDLKHPQMDKNGKRISAEIAAYPVFDREGNVFQIIIHSPDLKRRFQLEETLRESEAQYRLLRETMNDGFIMVDENQAMTYANDKLCEMLGYKSGEIIGRPATNLFDEANMEIWLEQFTKRRKGESSSYEITWTKKDGTKVRTIVSPKPIVDETGNFKGSFSVITDITQLKKTEQALREREKELEIKTKHLEESNIALKVLLKRIEGDKAELEENVLSNMNELIAPYLEKLMNSKLDERQEAYASILESNLNNIISPFARKLTSKYLNLTPAELQVANLVREGRTTKEIGNLLHLSSRRVETHRKNIRKKMGLTDKKANLQTKLLSLQ